MSLNYVEIDKIIQELDLAGAYLQKVKPIDYETFTFFFYKKSNPINVVISVNRYCRIHRLTKNSQYLGKSHNLVEYLKAYIVGGVVKSSAQVDKNRVIKIEIDKNGTLFNLYIRLWGGFSNIIITDRNNIIQHLHRKSSKKLELPGLLFTLPTPLVDKKSYELKEHNYPSYNEFIEAEYFNTIQMERLEKEELKLEHFRLKRAKQIDSQIKKLNLRMDKFKEAEKFKLYGDIILSNIYRLKKGDNNLIAMDYIDNREITIPLKIDQDPVANSETYYKKYKKSATGLQRTQKEINELEKEKLELNSVSPSTQSLEKPTKENLRPGLEFNSKGWTILVGRNARENEALFRRYIRGNDMWLHVRDFPGGWVFIKYRKDKTFPLDILVDAGNLAILYSKAKENKKADIMYTQAKYLKKIKGGKPGEVIAANNKNLYVTLDKNRVNTLKSIG